MGSLSRGDFLNTAAAFGSAATLAQIIPGVWVDSANGEAPGFFESEFGIIDEQCRKVLDKALSKGVDFADL